MRIEISASELASLKDLLDSISMIGLYDCGPGDEGWRSEELEASIQTLRNIVAAAEKTTIDFTASPPR